MRRICFDSRFFRLVPLFLALVSTSEIIFTFSYRCLLNSSPRATLKTISKKRTWSFLLIGISEQASSLGLTSLAFHDLKQGQIGITIQFFNN